MLIPVTNDYSGPLFILQICHQTIRLPIQSCVAFMVPLTAKCNIIYCALDKFIVKHICLPQQQWIAHITNILKATWQWKSFNVKIEIF